MIRGDMDWVLGRRFNMTTSRKPSDGRPGFMVKVVLDFTVVSCNDRAGTLRVHMTDGSRQLVDSEQFWDGIMTGVIIESILPPFVHDRPVHPVVKAPVTLDRSQLRRRGDVFDFARRIKIVIDK
jgi:hypothetical protein